MANSESTTRVRAAVLRRPPGPLETLEVVLATPGPREVLVRTAAAGLCHSDLTFVRGRRAHELPFVPGHEAAGIVERVGAAVDDLVVGDHVVLCPATGCGACRLCTSQRPWLCTGRALLERDSHERPRLTRDGVPVHQFRGLSTFAEAMLVHERSVTRIDRSVPLDLAAVLGCAVVTGAGSVCNQDLRPGATIAVLGCGGVGLNTVRAAALGGAGQVIAVDVTASSLELARRFGATDTVDATTCDPVAEVRRLAPGGVDYAFEVVGGSRSLRLAFDLLAVGGTAFMVGLAPDGEEVSLPLGDLLHDRSVKGLYIGSTDPRRDIPRYAGWYLDGLLDLGALVAERIGLDDVEDAYRDLEGGGRVARSVVVFSG